MLEEYISVDLEMTGLNVKTDRIIEIGAVHIRNGKKIATFHVMINPHRELNEEIKLITGLEDADLIEGEEAIDGVQAFIDFQQGLPIIAHHVISDYSFLKQAMVNGKKSYEVKAVDTLSIARKVYPDMKSKALQYLAMELKLGEQQSHRALEDAITTAYLFERMKKDRGELPEFLYDPKPLYYKIKKQGSITKVQMGQLNRLIVHHKISKEIDIASLTKSEASRMIDKITFRYGRMTQDDV